MRGFEKRVYCCKDCGEFEVDTEKFSQCKCGKNDMKVDYDYGYEYRKLNIKKRLL